jgi:formylglycine-generating enzyme required for sulfatase activity
VARSWVLSVGLTVGFGWLTLATACDELPAARPGSRSPTATKARDQTAAERTRGGITNSLGMQLVALPPGEFLMGASDADELAREDEKPRHRVCITQGFFVAAHEVTVGQFRAFVEATGFKTAAETDGGGSSGYDPARRGFEYDSPKYSWRVTGYPQGDKHPVVNVNWHDAQAFCKWLGSKEGRPYRLPTEAEWEFACRAGTSSRFVTDEAVGGLRPTANLCDRTLERLWDTSTVRKYGLDPAKIQFLPWDDGHAFTAPVGSYEPNALGLYDMLGNVGEFCADGYDADYYATSPVENPSGPSEETKGHVVRGGTFLNDARLVRVTSRVECQDKYRNYVIGFRVVAEAGS